jgi:thiol-disulfide isomerase/thioredoxin
VRADFERVDAAQIRSHIQSASRPYTLVNFYATWCKPCKVELPELIDLQNDKTSQVNVMLVSMDEPEVVENKLASFLQDQKVDFPSYVVEGDPEALVKAFHPEWDGYIPVSMVFTRDGEIIEILGMTDRQEVEMIINRNELLNN